MIEPKKIIKISSYLTKIHHTKGRIRVRVSAKIKEQSNNVTLEDIESLPKKVQGIKEIKINKLMGSVTVLYNHTVFPYELWEDLLAQKNSEKIADILNELSREVM